MKVDKKTPLIRFVPPVPSRFHCSAGNMQATSELAQAHAYFELIGSINPPACCVMRRHIFGDFPRQHALAHSCFAPNNVGWAIFPRLQLSRESRFEFLSL